MSGKNSNNSTWQNKNLSQILPDFMLCHIPRAQYSYGDDAPCYSAPRMLEEALKTSLRCEDFKDWSYSIEDVDGSSNIRHHGIKLSQDE